MEAPVVEENSPADDTLTIDLGDITTDSSDSVVAETPAVESLASEEVVETATDLSSLDM